MKKHVIAIIATLTVTGVVSLGVLLNPLRHAKDPGFNGGKLLSAVQEYRAALQASGTVLPATVSLQELTNRGFLHARDVAAFAGLETTITLSAKESRPHEVLMRARFPDGDELVALADGSVQHAR